MRISGTFVQSVHPSHTPLHIIYVSSDPPHAPDTGGVPQLGRPLDLQRNPDSRCMYPPIGEAMEAEGLGHIK